MRKHLDRLTAVAVNLASLTIHRAGQKLLIAFVNSAGKYIQSPERLLRSEYVELVKRKMLIVRVLIVISIYFHHCDAGVVQKRQMWFFEPVRPIAPIYSFDHLNAPITNPAIEAR